MRVRERHQYYFRWVYLTEKTVADLYRGIMDAFKDYMPLWTRSRDMTSLRIYSVIHAFSTLKQARTTARILKDEQVAAFRLGEYLEVIFV